MTTVASVNNWLVIQQRIDATVSFHVAWSFYKGRVWNEHRELLDGIGEDVPDDERGNLSITHRYLTTGGKWYSEEYDSFSVGPESSYYVLSVPSSGYYDDYELLNNIAPFPYYSTNGMPFSTTDQDHDNFLGSSCADKDKGGWWYNYCTWINLNGDYGTDFWTTGGPLLYPYVYLKTSRIMIKLV